MAVARTEQELYSTGSPGRVGSSSKPTTTEPAWTATIESVIQHIKWQIKVSDEKKTALAKKMFEIIEKEKELAKKEKLERIKLRKDAKRSEEGV